MIWEMLFLKVGILGCYAAILELGSICIFGVPAD
jgi:hypothetical protein